jgi:hypothetical protein
MNDRQMPVAAILSAGVGLGFAGDFLLRGSGGPGLNLALLFAGLAASLILVSRQGGAPIGREAGVLIAVGVVFGAGLLWRGSELLRFLAFVAASAAFALPALRAGGAWVREARVADLFEAVVASGAWAGLGSLALMRRENREALASDESRGTARTVARSVVVGVLLAALPLLVFGALFISADRSARGWRTVSARWLRPGPR